MFLPLESGVENWMEKLSLHYKEMKQQYPEDKMLLVFDIDGTILDVRYMVQDILLAFDRHFHTSHFCDLDIDDIPSSSDPLDIVLEQQQIGVKTCAEIRQWYAKKRWVPYTILQSHRPFRGVLEVMRWFQMQKNTFIGLNSARPEAVREDTLWCLNELGKEFRLQFSSELLHLNHHEALEAKGGHDSVERSKIDGLRHFQSKGYRPIAMVDNEYKNLDAVGSLQEFEEVLLLHPTKILNTQRRGATNQVISGQDYELKELFRKEELPSHVQFVWQKVSDQASLEKFLQVDVHWAETDVIICPKKDSLALQTKNLHYSNHILFEESLSLEDLLEPINNKGRGLKINLEGGAPLINKIAHFSLYLSKLQSLWFEAPIDTTGKHSFEHLRKMFPNAVLQTQIDFLGTVLEHMPEHAKSILSELHSWGINSFSLTWNAKHRSKIIEACDRWGFTVHISEVKTLESFLQSVLLLPSSISVDFTSADIAQNVGFKLDSIESEERERKGRLQAGTEMFH